MAEQSLQQQIENTKRNFDNLKLEISKFQSDYEKTLADLEQQGYTIDKSQITEFMKKFWYTHPTNNPNEWEVVVPVFVPLKIGYWDRTEGGYNIFIINRCTKWFGDKIPDYINREIKMPPEMKITVDGINLSYPEDKQEQIESKFGKHLSLIQKGKATVRQGHEVDLMAEIIESGSLPFTPHPVDSSDLMESDFTQIWDELEQKYYPLKIFEGKYSYQGDAWKLFEKYGCLGIFWAPSFGKTVEGTYIFSRIKGRKALIVPTHTLEEQWIQFFKWNCPRLLNEVDIYTYQGMSRKSWEELKNKNYICIGYEECHRLPADGFSRLGTIKTKYRFGTSATPYREDKRIAWIMALTGYPTGTDWQTTMQVLGKEYHTVNVHVVKDLDSKYALLNQLYNPDSRTVVFVRLLEIGERASKQLGIPFISGETKNRLDIIKQSKSFVASQVLDEGISIKDLEHVIEIDFHHGSRNEELQRNGRLMHSIVQNKIHDIIMTRGELESYGKRLFSLYERGFRPRLIPHTTGIQSIPAITTATTNQQQPRKTHVKEDYNKIIDELYNEGYFRADSLINDVSKECQKRGIDVDTETRKLIWVKVNRMVRNGLLYRTKTDNGYQFKSRSQ